MRNAGDPQNPSPIATGPEHGRPLRLEMWPIERLVPSPRNARTHSDAQVAEIAGSIRAFGFASPILVGADGDVIAGHGRLAAARKLGLTQVPVVLLSGLTEVQRRQLMLADNRIALNAGWDLDMLRLELQDLSALGADLKTLGFSKHELAKALTGLSGGLTDEDAVPEVAEVAVSRTGDVWALGPHRVACGDSTDATVVTRLFGPEKPNLMVTDPPYGVNYDPAWRLERRANRSTRTARIANDDRADWGAAWELFPGPIAYVWHGALHAATVHDSLVRTGFTVRAQIIWAKERLVMGRGDYHWQHEPCFYAVRNDAHWQGARDQTTLWTIGAGAEEDEATVHGTQKPVECMRRPLLNNSSPDDCVYDPFLGSGTTLIAAESTGRVCFGMELEPRFVDVAVRRWQAFTGQAAMLAGDGRSFDAVAAERQASPSIDPAEDGALAAPSAPDERGSVCEPIGGPSAEGVGLRGNAAIVVGLPAPNTQCDESAALASIMEAGVDARSSALQPLVSDHLHAKAEQDSGALQVAPDLCGDALPGSPTETRADIGAASRSHTASCPEHSSSTPGERRCADDLPSPPA